MLGAFGAHALKARLGPELLATWQTAVQYHFLHALGLLVVGMLARQMPDARGLHWAGWLMLTGVLLFSGSLYALCLTGVRGLGAITPAGGAAFIAAWAVLAWVSWRS
ncbi:MAG: DUF423 domain-containing protein [Betaproteobacteria bacterium]|nr:DUF423 domain-containing protein [Betaproteobacteria bacterium]